MHMQGWDWLMVLLPLTLVVWLVVRTRRMTRSVADFMAANRCARRYLLCTAQGESFYGLISAVAGFEIMAGMCRSVAEGGQIALPLKDSGVDELALLKKAIPDRRVLLGAPCHAAEFGL